MKTLSDKIRNNLAGECLKTQRFDSIPVEDVKEFIKEVVDIVETDYTKDLKIKAIKQAAGDKLI